MTGSSCGRHGPQLFEHGAPQFLRLRAREHGKRRFGALAAGGFHMQVHHLKQSVNDALLDSQVLHAGQRDVALSPFQDSLACNQFASFNPVGEREVTRQRPKRRQCEKHQQYETSR